VSLQHPKENFMKNMKYMSFWILGSLTLAGTSVNSAFAQDEMRKMENGPGTYHVSSVDQLVLSKIHHGNVDEIKAAKLALKKSNLEEVKNAANTIIKDHSAADVQVKDVAKADNIRLLVPLPPQSNDEKKAMAEDKVGMNSLKKLEGVTFDTEYQKMMIADHKKDIAELTDVQPKLKNENVRDLVASLIPKFQHHEQLLSEIDVNKNTKTAENDQQ
jgi:putative membrane protein